MGKLYDAIGSAQLNNKHGDMVQALAKDPTEILSQLRPGTVHLMHMVLGIGGEAGELIDAAKKAIIYNRDLDRANVVEELGDLEFYMEGLRQGLGISREETLEGNLSKLASRYQDYKYSDEQAHLRRDKAGE